MRLSRLRSGEWIVGVTSVALLVVVFATPWYGLRGVLAPTAAQFGAPVTADGWNSLTLLGPLSLLVGLLGIAVWWLQATRRSPALPVSATVMEALLSGGLAIGLVVRVIIAPPRVLIAPPHGFASAGSINTITAKPGAYVGLALAVIIFAGTYRSLRVDGVAAPEAGTEIETVRLARADPRPRADRT